MKPGILPITIPSSPSELYEASQSISRFKIYIIFGFNVKAKLIPR